MILKLYRRLETGTKPDLEVGRFLTEQTRFGDTAPLAGYLEYRPAKGPHATLGMLQGFVANEGDAWSYMLDELARWTGALHRQRRPSEPRSGAPGQTLKRNGSGTND